MLRSLSILFVGGVLVGGLGGCTADDNAPDGAASPSGGQPTSTSTASPTVSSSATPSMTLRDPLLDLAEGNRGRSVQGQTPLISQQGSAQGQYTLAQNGKKTDAIVTVSCVGPGRYTVTGDGSVLLDSECTGKAAANIRLPLARMGSKIEVTAPSSFWVTIVPAI